MRRNQVRSAKNGIVGRRPGRGFSFGFFLLAVLVMAACGLLMVLMQQLALKSDVATRLIENRTSAELTRQKSLRLELVRLKSPGRVAKLARDELGMEEPAGVIYLKYVKDDRGNLASSSTYESWSQPPAAAGEKQDSSVGGESTVNPGGEEKTADNSASMAGKEPSKTLTRK